MTSEAWSDHATMLDSGILPATGAGPWLCQLICCGHDDGRVRVATWDDADALRESYTSGPGVHPRGYSALPCEPGHRRVVIVTRDVDPEGGRMKPIKPVIRWAVKEPSGRLWVNNNPKARREETERDYCGPMDVVVRVEIREIPKGGKA